MPAIEPEHTEFDIAADSCKAHRVLDQVPDVAVSAVAERHLGMAIAPLDRPFLTFRQVSRLAYAKKVHDRHVRQVGNVTDLITEPLTDPAEYASVRTGA